MKLLTAFRRFSMVGKIILIFVCLLPLNAPADTEFDVQPCADGEAVMKIAALDTPITKGVDQFVRSAIKAEGGKLVVGKAFSIKKFDTRTVYLVPSREGQRERQRLSPKSAARSLGVRVSCSCATSGSCGWYQDAKNLVCQGSCSKCEMGMTTSMSPSVQNKL